jgi:hypothetical protein
MIATILSESKTCVTLYTIPSNYSSLGQVMITDPVGNIIKFSQATYRKGWRKISSIASPLSAEETQLTVE